MSECPIKDTTTKQHQIVKEHRPQKNQAAELECCPHVANSLEPRPTPLQIERKALTTPGQVDQEGETCFRLSLQDTPRCNSERRWASV